MCPDGVPMVAFDECATYTRGITYNKKQESDPKDTSANKILRANNITLEANCLNFNDIKFVKGEVKIRQDQWLKAGDILICAGSGSKEHIGKVAYIDDDISFSFGGFMAVIRPQSKTISRYLFHNLIGRTFKDYLNSALNSTTINNLNSAVMNGFQIPLPPLPIQQRIVEILDKFTSLVSSLDSEIALRQKQYEYYRNKLLTFEEGKEGVEWKKLGELCKNISSGKCTMRADNGKYAVYGSTGIIAYTDEYVYDRDQILVARVGANAGYVHIAKGKYDVTDNTLILNLKDDSLLTYLFFILSRENLNQYAKGGGQPLVTGKDLKELLFPIPTKSRQHSIVRTLDTFESLLTNLKKERALRQKQYEYYREKLLTFA